MLGPRHPEPPPCPPWQIWSNARLIAFANTATVGFKRHNGHNHPSGNPEPSAADRAVTARLKQALALVDLRLLDHFVIADGPPVSLAARGWV